MSDEKKTAIKEVIEDFQEEEVIRIGLDGVATTALQLLQRLADAEEEVVRLREENERLIERIHSLSGPA